MVAVGITVPVCVCVCGVRNEGIVAASQSLFLTVPMVAAVVSAVHIELPRRIKQALIDMQASWRATNRFFVSRLFVGGSGTLRRLFGLQHQQLFRGEEYLEGKTRRWCEVVGGGVLCY